MMTNKYMLQLENFERDFQHANAFLRHNVNITSHFAAPRRSKNNTNNQYYMKYSIIYSNIKTSIQ
jgi:hypothetical protein